MMRYLCRNRIFISSNRRCIKSFRFQSTTQKAEQKASSTDSVPIGASLFAAFVGVAGVSAAAAVVELATAQSCLPYSVNGQRYDQDEFIGRFSRMLLACDPFLLVYSTEQIREAQALLRKADSYKEDRSMDRTLWEARRIVDAAVHPDTQEIIPRPFRMSG